jgi:hypothetical protein
LTRSAHFFKRCEERSRRASTQLRYARLICFEKFPKDANERTLAFSPNGDSRALVSFRTRSNPGVKLIVPYAIILAIFADSGSEHLLFHARWFDSIFQARSQNTPRRIVGKSEANIYICRLKIASKKKSLMKVYNIVRCRVHNFIYLSDSQPHSRSGTKSKQLPLSRKQE